MWNVDDFVNDINIFFLFNLRDPLTIPISPVHWFDFGVMDTYTCI